MRIIAKAESLTSNGWELWKLQAGAALNPPTHELGTGPGSAAKPLDLTSDGPIDVESTGSSQLLDKRQQADAAYKLLHEWSKTDSGPRDIMEGMQKNWTVTQHGVQTFNSKVEAATKAVLQHGTTAQSDLAKAAKDESLAVIEWLMAKARDDPDFRALTASVSKGITTDKRNRCSKGMSWRLGEQRMTQGRRFKTCPQIPCPLKVNAKRLRKQSGS
ncbi:hypothetical protein DOTSEDRAFT_71162 [Dothistroma septosporum NZE10]|uniref:Uncharacterized protein n=1 Tax=Dothistroma septosporum (strain NZE10 / CBS 128990) TaxID=675120 RepID=N1PSJ6_DOTSN|nr:hypothetical protein DOTSEDRAFT_71162 [Dothistroma septosporum NZE10]